MPPFVHSSVHQLDFFSCKRDKKGGGGRCLRTYYEELALIETQVMNRIRGIPCSVEMNF